MNRMKVMSSKEEFLKVFPEKTNLVIDYSLAEMFCLLLKLRNDVFIPLDIMKLNDDEGFDLFKENFARFFEVSNDKAGIINGVICFPREMTVKDFILFKKLIRNDVEFSKGLFDIHTDGMKEFISANKSAFCGNTLLHCSEEEFKAVLSSIDFEFTTVNNLLTAIRADLVDSDVYGRIRVNNNVFIVNMVQSYKDNACIGVFIDKLRK